MNIMAFSNPMSNLIILNKRNASQLTLGKDKNNGKQQTSKTKSW